MTVSCLDSALPSIQGGRMGNAKFKKSKINFKPYGSAPTRCHPPVDPGKEFRAPPE